MGAAVRRTWPQSRITAGPVRSEIPITAAQKSELRGRCGPTSRSKPDCWERNLWMQRQGAKNHDEKGETPAETKEREVSDRKSPQKRPIWRGLGKGGFAEPGWGAPRRSKRGPSAYEAPAAARSLR